MNSRQAGRIGLVFFVAALLGACNAIPKDPEGTTERVRSEGQFRVGVIESDAPLRAAQELFLKEVVAAAGARPVVERAASDVLLEKLEMGELDLVVGELSPKTPWAMRVSLLPLLDEQVTKDGHSVLAAAARNGENEWISLLHREATEVAAMQ